MKPYTHKVNYYETDKMGITHHSNYVRFMEEARVDFLDQIGWSFIDLENKGIALSREKILNSVWNYDYFGDARTIDTHVKKLRSKLGDKGDYIKTIWGMGYKFEVEG